MRKHISHSFCYILCATSEDFLSKSILVEILSCAQEMRAITTISLRVNRAAHDEILIFFSQNLRESPNGDAGG